VARRFPARLNINKEIILIVALKEAKGLTAGNYSSDNIIGITITLILRDILNSDLSCLLLYSF
jgi:hypothetical protein